VLPATELCAAAVALLANGLSPVVGCVEDTADDALWCASCTKECIAAASDVALLAAAGAEKNDVGVLAAGNCIEGGAKGE
jgi:hypothetical protein